MPDRVPGNFRAKLNGVIQTFVARILSPMLVFILPLPLFLALSLSLSLSLFVALHYRQTIATAPSRYSALIAAYLSSRSSRVFRVIFSGHGAARTLVTAICVALEASSGRHNDHLGIGHWVDLCPIIFFLDPPRGQSVSIRREFSKQSRSRRRGRSEGGERANWRTALLSSPGIPRRFSRLDNGESDRRILHR